MTETQRKCVSVNIFFPFKKTKWERSYVSFQKAAVRQETKGQKWGHFTQQRGAGSGVACKFLLSWLLSDNGMWQNYW